MRILTAFFNLSVVSYLVFTIFHSPSALGKITAYPYSKNTVYVMEIDTGVDASDRLLKPYIDTIHSVGLKDGDPFEHGTNVAGIILYGKTIEEGRPKGLCPKIKLISCNKIQPYYSNIPYCLRLAEKTGVKYVNISAGGNDPSRTERRLMAILEAKGVTFVLAAGNDNRDIDKVPYYPASYHLSRSIVVGDGLDSKHRFAKSNWGKNLVWKDGYMITSTGPDNSYTTMSGTSQAAPLELHDILKSLCDTKPKLNLKKNKLHGIMNRNRRMYGKQ